MKNSIKIFAANNISKKLGISNVRFYEYIKTGKIMPDYYHLSNNNNKHYYFNEDTVKDICKWHSEFKKSNDLSLKTIEQWWNERNIK